MKRRPEFWDPASRLQQEPGPVAPALDELLESVGLGPTRPIPALDVRCFDAALPAASLAQTFGLDVPPEHFGIGDLLWSENVVRQLEGADALRDGAAETMRAWYRTYAQPFYFEKLQRSRAQPVAPGDDRDADADAAVSASVDGAPLH